jgi:hypothetical protein
MGLVTYITRSEEEEEEELISSPDIGLGARRQVSLQESDPSWHTDSPIQHLQKIATVS